MATLALSLAGQVVGGALGGPFGATLGRALGALAGSAVDAVLFGDAPEARPGADVRLTGSSEGGAVPRLYGWGRLAGNVVWATELEEISGESSGAKGTAEAAESLVVASFAVAFCEGEVSRLGRIWADGQLLETEGLNLRFYRGGEDQPVDGLIAAVQEGDAAPAYRGVCYLVFERLPLGPFGNRIPSISAELCRAVGELEPAIRAITLIPGATEFGYDPTPRVRVVGPGRTAHENAHLSAQISDFTLSVDELCDLCPNLQHVSLVVAWFGDDLRAGACTIRPKVEAAERAVSGAEWSVAGLERGDAQVVSSHDGGPAFGGTPSDGAVLAAMAALQERGLAVTLYPLILMDVPEGNPMGQPAYPWRGRIAADPEGDVAAQIGDFVGGAEAWGFRRFVWHHAALAAEGGADALVLGSELVGLTTGRDGADFPFVAALVELAAEARAIAGPAVKLTYAADWSEYHGFRPEDAPGDKLFHLDPLWACADIDAVGIDNYMPVADWRDGEDHADAAGWDGPHALGYLAAGIAGGEGFDWYYASDADRLAGTRTPIADGTHGEPWVWRFKDLAGWWGSAHHERVGGVRSPTPTAWVPEGKPIWFTELGCAAVDKGANQPNMFPDPKSAEDGRPHFSTGAPDPLAQRQFLRAHLSHWVGAGNPVSAVYDAPMVDPERIYLWCWDVRPFPAFPGDGETWKDAANHAAGHWLTGRLGGAAADELIAAVAADYGVGDVTAEAAGPLVGGMLVERAGSAREALEPLLGATGLRVRDGAGGLAFVRPGLRGALAIAGDDLAVGEGPIRSRRRPDPSEAVGRLALGYFERERDYLAASVTALRLGPGASEAAATGLVLDAGGARQVAERMLLGAATAGDRLEVALPHSFAALEVGDTLALDGEAEGPFVVAELRDGEVRRVVAHAVPPQVVAAVAADAPRGGGGAPAAAALPVVVAAQLPGEVANPGTSVLLLAAWASPWPGEIEVRDTATGATLARLGRAAWMGRLATPLTAGRIHLWDRREVTIELYGGHVAGLDEGSVLAGGNRLAVETDAGGWEVLGFAFAELVAPGTYRLRRLLRGLGGTDPVMGAAAAGNRVVLLDGRAAMLPVPGEWLGTTRTLTAYAGRHDATGTAVTVELRLDPLLPLPPTHVMARSAGGDVVLTWVRRSRTDSDNWALAEAPQDNAPEAYLVTIIDGDTPVRSIAAAAPAATYTAAQQAADFGAPPASFAFTVQQVSPVFGPGHAASGHWSG